MRGLRTSARSWWSAVTAVPTLMMSILMVSVLVLAGCSLSVDGSARSGQQQGLPAPAASTASSASTATRPTAEPVGTPGANCPNNSLEGCFDYDQMDQFLDIVTPKVVSLYGDQYRNLAKPRSITYIPHGDSGTQPCTDASGAPAPADSESYFYCPVNQTIYLGQDMVWDFYSQLGDAAPVVGLAHEYGHHIQTVTGVPAPRSAEESINYENQADCLAGAWTLYAAQDGFLEYPQDLGDIDRLMEVIASSESDMSRDHGSLTERVGSFNRGFGGGIEACNDFYPGTPVIG